MALSTWNEFSAALTDDDIALLERLREFAMSHDGVTESVKRTEIAWSRQRIFTSAYVKSHWLEIGVDLTEEVSHPLLRTVYPTSKRIFTHRFTLSKASEVRSVMKFIRKARKDVGPGFKPKPKA